MAFEMSVGSIHGVGSAFIDCAARAKSSTFGLSASGKNCR